MRIFAFFPLVGLLAFTPAATTLVATAQAGSFTINQHGKAVGTASFNFKATPEGYDSTSLVLSLIHISWSGRNARQDRG